MLVRVGTLIGGGSGAGDSTPGGSADVLTDDDELTALTDDDGATYLTDD